MPWLRIITDVRRKKSSVGNLKKKQRKQQALNELDPQSSEGKHASAGNEKGLISVHFTKRTCIKKVIRFIRSRSVKLLSFSLGENAAVYHILLPYETNQD